MFAAILLCLASPGQFPADRPDIYRGVVLEQGTDRPLAGVTVRAIDGFDVPTATTDARGRFDGVPAPDTSWFPVDGQNGPYVRIRAEDDRAWPWTPAGDGGRPRKLSEYQEREVIEGVYERTIQSRWKGRGPMAELVVECPPVGVVEAVVRDPDGRPLADAAIIASPLMEFPRAAAGTIHFAGRTDHAGAFRLRSFEGPREFGVLVAGVGFGSTGRIEVVGGETVRPEIPPLARFARVEGRIDDALKGPGAEAILTESDPAAFSDAPRSVAACDDEGRFTITDVPPGNYQLGVRRGDRKVSHIARQLRLGPGQIVRDAVVYPAPPPPPDAEQRVRQDLRALNGDPTRTVGWVEGTIRDERGRPIAGATVSVHVVYNGGIRAHSDVKSATTDAEGSYRIEGPLYAGMGSITVMVAAKGRPMVVAHAPAPSTQVDPEDLKASRLDVAMGAKGGSLAVAVVRDGRAVPGADVVVTSAEANRTFGEFARPTAVEELNELRRAAVPGAAAGADGVARFDDLPPGVYSVTASGGANPNQDPGERLPWSEPARGVANSIEIPPGGSVETSVAITGGTRKARFRLLGPNGAAVANRTVSLGYGRGGATTRTSVKTDERGEGAFSLHPGLWTVELRYGDAESNVMPGNREPFNLATRLIPISPALDDSEPVVFHAVRRGLGSIKVRLLGLDGAPARGGVMVSRQAGSVDEEGWVRFAGMPSGKYSLRGAIDGAADVPMPRGGPRRLADEELLDRAMVRDREATVETGAETVVELRAEPVGYVRATVHASAGRSPSDYMVRFSAGELSGRFPSWEVSEDRANYLFGPAPPGRWPIVVSELAGDQSGNLSRGRSESEVVVEPGRVVRVDLDAPLSPEKPAVVAGRGMVRLGMGGVGLFDSGPDGAAITVVMPDGETPAFGARALFIPAEGRAPTATGTADAAGRLTWTGFWRAQRAGGDQPEPVKEPTVLAWAPGGFGPAVATIKSGEPLRLTLPAAVVVSGRATIGGEAVAGRDARIRVALVSEGKGAVDVAMGRDATADADGRFHFDGLAPGRYVVQAVRDELWTSRPAALSIEPGADAPSIDLDIPAPGATIALELVNRRGEPIAAAFSIKRPAAGPLADLAPIDGRGDERGSATVRGLATGVYELTVEGADAPVALDVPPSQPGAGPLAVRVEVSRPGP